ncbi:RAMP superfamily CRISPR-associated protein [Leptotrichia alba]|uniref:RAMP superfamily CRISPR-associated protein n=1 Tax=Leptotrichia alba TaxID=3239304 RepID=A0AB39V288_9FUSO
MRKEFLKLENKLVLELEIEPLSPLIIKLGDGSEENSKNEKSESVISFVTSDSPRGNLVEYDKNKKSKDDRKGEIFIPGSTLKGLFREKFNKIYDIKKDDESDFKAENKNHKEVDNLFGWTEGDKAQKGRIFIEDAYLENQDLRENFYTKDINESLEVIMYRDITPIDGFTGKATVPLNYECTMEPFVTELIVNNLSLEELKNIFFVLRDSHLGEIRLGNSKTRGFGQVKFNIQNMVIENYRDKTKFVVNLKNYFEIDSLNSIKLGNEFLREDLILKKEFKEINVKNPNEFIKALFREVE